MNASNGERTTVTTTWQLNHPASVIWPQLCPVREYDWIEPWQCELIHSQSGFNELGCVFKTDFPTEGGPEIWLTSRFEPFERIEFVRTNDTRVIRYVIKLEETETGTRMDWTQHVTALNDKGREFVKNRAETFLPMMAVLEKMLDHFLTTGTMLKGEDIGLTE